jgi:hypothetical protein
MGYRVRPAWIWERKRLGTLELIIGVSNDGVAGIPGVLRRVIESADGKFRQSGSLDGGHPHGGKTRQASFLLPSDIGGGGLSFERRWKPGVVYGGRYSGRAHNL